MSSEKVIIIENLSKRFGEISVLDNISIQVNKGEFFVFMGPSPSGKTTLLRCIAGLEKPSSGSIYVNGKNIADIPSRKRNIPLMFQNYALFPHMRVFENIAFGLKSRGYPKDRIRKEVEEIMNLTGLTGLGNRRIRELSGGQQQRVALARSIVPRSEILLLDEPIANLDAKLQMKMTEEFREIRKKLNFTVLYVTHSIEQAMNLGDRVAILNKGRIEQIGKPEELYTRPKSLFTAKFTGILNHVSGRIISRDDGTISIESNSVLLKGTGEISSVSQKAIYAVRPEDIMLENEAEKCDNIIKAELVEQTYKGSDMEYFVQLSDGTTFIIIKKGSKIVDLTDKIGDKILLGWDTDKALVFEEQ